MKGYDKSSLMKKVLVSILFLALSISSYSQSFGEIQKVERIGDKIFRRGARPLINTSYDQVGMYQFTLNDLVPTKGRKSFWEKKNNFTLDVNEVAFVNWNAGGTNSISGLYGMRIVRTYRNDGFRWDNQFRFRYGVNQQEEQELRKTDDDLELSSSFGYEVSKDSKWFYSGRFSFRTQVARGFNYPNTEVAISEFMAPGYMFLGVGAKYVEPNEKFELYLSPLTQRTTFVMNQRLANQGSFGVQAAVRDADGNIIEEGENIRNELGIQVTNQFETEVFENTNLISRANLYTDYLNDFGNIVIDWELILNFRINNYMRANIGMHIRYDDDIKTQQEDASGNTVEAGPRIQLKQQLGIGVALDL